MTSSQSLPTFQFHFLHSQQKRMVVCVSTIAGKPKERGNIDGRLEESRFSQPRGISFDSRRNLFIADLENSSIRKLSPNGRVSTVIDSGTLHCPCSVRYSSDGTLLIADTYNHVIKRISIDEIRSTYVETLGVPRNNDGSSHSPNFRYPYDVLLDSHGGVLVADHDNCMIRRISPDGTVSTIERRVEYDSTIGKLECSPHGLCMDEGGDLIIFSSMEPSYLGVTRIERITLNGEITLLASNETPLTHPLKGVGCGSFLPNGELVFTDWLSHTVRILRKDGEIEILAGQYDVSGYEDGYAKDEALFNLPWGICVDEEGSIFVADSGNHCIRMISRMGWRKEDHHYFPTFFRSQVRTLMTLWMIRESIIHWLPRDILFFLFDIMDKSPRKEGFFEQSMKILLRLFG